MRDGARKTRSESAGERANPKKGRPRSAKSGARPECLGEGESINSTSSSRKTQEFAYKATGLASQAG
jgi:hypothetical protein